MKILEIDLPSFVNPVEPTYLEPFDAVVFPSNSDAPYTGKYYAAEKALKLVLFGDSWNNKNIEEFILNFIKFKNFLYQDYNLYKWLNQNPINHLETEIREVDDLNNYIEKKLDQSVEANTNLLTKFVDYKEYPLIQLTPNPETINFLQLFSIFHSLDLNDKSYRKLNQLIDYFSFISNSVSLIHSYYNNINFQLSNTWSIIEVLLKMKIKNQSTNLFICSSCHEEHPIICPHCSSERISKKRMKAMIIEYVNEFNFQEDDKELFISLLQAYYSVRNDYFHDIKKDTVVDMYNKMMSKTGKKEFNLKDEVKHMNGAMQGLMIVNNFIRLELIKLLVEKESIME